MLVGSQDAQTCGTDADPWYPTARNNQGKRGLAPTRPPPLGVTMSPGRFCKRLRVSADVGFSGIRFFRFSKQVFIMITRTRLRQGGPTHLMKSHKP